MEEYPFNFKVTCPNCGEKFKPNIKEIDLDNVFICSNCNANFTIEECVDDSRIKLINAFINEAEKGNIKISSQKLNEMRDFLSKLKS